MRRFLKGGESWQVIGAFTGTGFAVAGACYAWAAIYDYTKPMSSADATLALISVIFCPAQLLFTFCIDCEVNSWDGLIMYAIIGALNAGLYALIGLAVVSLRGPNADRPDLSQINK
jgi:hypothetical protein